MIHNYQSYQQPMFSQVKQTQYSIHNNEPINIYYATKKLQNINCIEESNAQYGGLYLGDIISVIKPEFIQNNNISAILSCLSQTNYPCNIPGQVIRKVIPAKDTLDYRLDMHFDQCFSFIQQMRKKKKNVLVHCHAGVSRSAAIVCAYLMKKQSWSCETALRFLKDKRNRVKPNESFLQQLKNYERTVKKRQEPKDQAFKKNNENVYIRNQQEKVQKARNSFQVRQFRQVNRNTNDQMFNNSSKSDLRKLNKSVEQLKQNISSKPRYSFGQPLQNNTRQPTNTKQLNVALQLTKKQSKGKWDKIKKVAQKDQLSFGQQFKNKISALLGRKTRIPWELSKNNNIEFTQENVSLNCF